MAKQALDLAIKGLYTSPSTFAGVPQGALTVADNIVIDQPNIARTRRGQANYGTSFSDTGIKSFSDFNNVMVVYDGAGKLWYDSDDAGTWVQYAGGYTVPDPAAAGSRIRFVQSNRNLYFLTQQGCYKLDSITGTPRLAGAPRALSGQGVTTGSTGFLPNSTQCAYRVVWGYKDANNNLILGAPSERIIVANSSGTSANVNVTFQVPDEVDTTWFYQLYRSVATPDLLTEPSDELQQAAEGIPTTGELTARSVTYTDRVPDTLLQSYLYTDASQQGILQANTRPPFAKDACLYKGYVFYANTRTVHTLDINLLATGTPDGLQVGDTITFTRISDAATFTLSAQTVESPAAGQFALSVTGDPAADIQATALSIAKVCNVYAVNTWLSGYYVSGYGDTPGQLEFQLNDLTETGFYINSSRTTAWTPSIQTTGSSFQSQNEVAANRIYWSKLLQPEAVPIGNWLEVGSKAVGIDRIVPLRDGIIILKQDGVFRLSNSTPDWLVAGLDNTVRILAPNTAVALDNQVHFLSDQGVVAASDSAVTILSYPIERTLLELTAPATFPNVADLAWGIGYSSDRKYILSLPLNGTDTFCGQQFCYNTITNSWTRWTRQANCGLVFIRDNKLYLGGPGSLGVSGWVTQERKAYTDADYADEDWPLTVTAVTSTSITVTDVSKVTVGSTVEQPSGSISDEVTSITGLTLNFANSSPWAVGSATVFTPIDSRLKTIQLDVGDAGIQKQFSEASFLFTLTNFTSMSAYFNTDMSGSTQVQTLRPPATGGWGLFNWGQAPWGGAVDGGQRRIRTMVPSLSARANWLFIELRLRQCFTSFGLSGITLITTDMSSRQRQAGDT